jgi:hypothetical protein
MVQVMTHDGSNATVCTWRAAEPRNVTQMGVLRSSAITRLPHGLTGRRHQEAWDAPKPRKGCGGRTLFAVSPFHTMRSLPARSSEGTVCAQGWRSAPSALRVSSSNALSARASFACSSAPPARPADQGDGRAPSPEASASDDSRRWQHIFFRHCGAATSVHRAIRAVTSSCACVQ